MINRAQKSVEDKERTWGCEEKQAGKMTKWTRRGMWEEEEKDKWREKGQRMAGDDREKKIMYVRWHRWQLCDGGIKIRLGEKKEKQRGYVN